MKELLFLMLFVLNYLAVNAQYRKMPLDTNHYWQEHCSYSPSMGQSQSNTYKLKVKKDSIINGKTYQFLYAYDLSCAGLYDAIFLRQDTLLKRVIILLGNQERILYNFDKNVGDTATLYCEFGGGTTYTLASKDSVLINDGFYHKRFSFGGIKVIEGVGSQNGLLFPYCIGIDSYTNLECLAQISPSLTIYSSGGIGTSCPVIANFNLNSDNKNILSIFPNPSSDAIHISAKNIIPKSIEITNIIGETVLSINKISEINVTVNLNNFVQGVYFVKVFFADKNVSRIFIKN